MVDTTAPRVHVIACGALARELIEVLGQLPNVTIECLPPSLHNRPDQIPDLVRQRVRARRADTDRILVGYADCGTGGLLDRVCSEEGAERLPGAHCYEVFAGGEAFAALHEQEPGTFYLTDYLARNFDRLVIEGLGIDRHPQLLTAYFGNYRRLVHLAQRDDPDLDEDARRAAARLGLHHERRLTGVTGLRDALIEIAS
ncbi:DUF1638 domain-containing protein [Nitriliruptor alkaliphilus]|uniref:DUF1638 domain-containing protein n=1 Tax=Nitriliruptor alkaliphilus TaxID=427918 RepID=UPI0006963195|nr:DUF1638 domain-containing protein [Nitriliruptor alkaliphilus]